MSAHFAPLFVSAAVIARGGLHGHHLAAQPSRRAGLATGSLAARPVCLPEGAKLEPAAMGALTSTEQQAVERAGGEPMLDQVLAWAAINSGSRNLAGLERMADVLADAFAALPGVLRLENAGAGRGGRCRRPDGQPIEHGRHLHLRVRPDGAGAAALHRAHGHGVRAPTMRSRRRAGSTTAC